MSVDSNVENVTLSDGPGIVTVNSPNELCEEVILSWNTATGATSYNVAVYNDPGLSSLVTSVSASSISTSQSINGLTPGTTYYYTIEPSNACGSSASPPDLSFTTNDLPVANSQTPPDVCEDAFGSGQAAVDLTIQDGAINSTGATITWFTDPGLSSAVGDPTNTMVNDGDVLYAEVDDGACTNSATVTYTINSLDDATFSYVTPLCQGAGNPVPATIATPGGTFSNTSGVVFADAATGEIDLALTPVGAHTITYTVGTCAATSTFDIDINAQPTAMVQTPATCEDAAGTGQAVVDLTSLESSVNSNAGFTFTWYLDNGLTSSVADASNETVSDGQILYVEVNDGTCTNVATVTYTVSPTIDDTPVVTPSASTCEGFTLSWNTIAGVDDYLIEISDDGFATILVKDSTVNQTLDITGLTVGTYNYRITPGNAGCGRSSANETIGVAETLPSAQCGCGFDLAAFNVVPTDASCIGATDGHIQVFTETSSTAPPSRFRFRYQSLDDPTILSPWDSTSSTLTGVGLVVFDPDTLSSGDYRIIIEDRNAGPTCVVADTIEVQVGVRNDIEVSVRAETCSALGVISLEIPDGCLNNIVPEYLMSRTNEDGIEESYSFLLDPPGSNTFVDLASGNYRIMMVNFNITTGAYDTITSINAFVPNNCSVGGGDTIQTTCSLGDKIVVPGTTLVDCGASAGTLPLSVEGGESETFVFSIQASSGIFRTETAQGSVNFTDVPTGRYIYTVVTEDGSASCSGTARVGDNGIKFDTTPVLPACDDPDQSADLTVTVDTLFSAASAPYDVYAVLGSDTVSTSFIDIGETVATLTGLPTGQSYQITVASRAASSCPKTETSTIPSTGEAALNFAYHTQDITCFGELGSVTLDSIQAVDGLSLKFILYRVDQNEAVEEALFNRLPLSYTFAQLAPGDYQLELEQQQGNCDRASRIRSETFRVEGPTAPLVAEVEERILVTVEYPYGNIEINNISGGGAPYEVRIAVDPAGETRDWVEVTNDNPAINPYQYVFADQSLGSYQIEVRDRFGCIRPYTVLISYTEEIFIPNIFTPNGDGDNDVFQVINLDRFTSDDDKAAIIITSRWGNKVFESDAYTEENFWDGGEYPDGLYFYQLRLPNGESYSGWVEIWRGRTP